MIITMQMVRDKIFHNPKGLTVTELLDKLDLGYHDAHRHMIEAYLGALAALGEVSKSGSKYKPKKGKRLPN